MKWKQPFFSGPMPCPRYGHAAFTYKNGLYVFGGTNEDDDFNDLTVGRLINPSNRKPLKVASTGLQGYLSGMSSTAQGNDENEA
ncbi:uncharacterized protein [Amphiura filiformis]|uniref:uncharacterized protein n=1 Tax=Amphiura filiformis TaxID=82378 RepID=UPI003B2266C5